MAKCLKFARWVVLGFASLVFAATQIPYEEARSNLASYWVALFPNNAVPSWMTGDFDRTVLLISLVVLMLLLIGPRIARQFKAIMQRRKMRRLNQGMSHLIISLSEPKPGSAGIGGQAAPEPNKFPLNEIAERWSKLYDHEYTTDQVRRMLEDGGFNLERTTKRVYPDGAARIERDLANIIGTYTVRYHYWITREDRDKFEAKQPVSEREHYHDVIKGAGVKKRD
jgi:hypothetical protein